jgi:DNA-binding IclR family transcriptional regulator
MSRTVPSIEKAVRILELLASSLPESLTLKEISTELELPRSTALAMCVTLADTEMITRNVSGTYRLGPKTVAIASAYLLDRNPFENLREVVAEVPELHEETLVLSVLDGVNSVYIAFHAGTHPLTIRYKVGMRLPAHCSASGKAMLSMLDESEVRSRLDGAELTEHSSGRSKDIDEILEDLRLSRERGYAIDNEEIARGMLCFGAAIVDVAGAPTAAVSVTAVKAALDPSDYTVYPEAIIRIAQRLSESRNLN